MTRPAQDGQSRRERRRGDLRWAVVAVALGALLTAIVVGGVWISEQLRTANSARDALAAQVERLGASPVGGPPGSRGEPGPSVTGPAGPAGIPGRAGASGAPGRAGRDGTNGKNGKAGASVAGAPGKPGKDGAKGDPGASVTGPPGAPGPTGPMGPAGKDGQDGKDGRDGRDGQTCPDGYSLQQSPDDTDALVCRRDGAPTQQPDSPSPTPPVSLGMAALDPTRRTWI
ncbi:collagen-like protein [Streptomyces sp. NPDC007903]|uniref:collagen-like protein n=1 Tax=Streptomyces sp. NPDC007903 TaxID=3364786 RepID=UPI0036E9A9D8